MHGDAIERWAGDAEGRSRASAWRDLVFTVATAPSPEAALAEQTRIALGAIDRNLADAGTDRTRIVSATVYVTDIGAKAEMDAVWCEWIGAPENWPQRACVEVGLAAHTLVEIVVVAARG